MNDIQSLETLARTKGYDISVNAGSDGYWKVVLTDKTYGKDRMFAGIAQEHAGYANASTDAYRRALMAAIDRMLAFQNRGETK